MYEKLCVYVSSEATILKTYVLESILHPSLEGVTNEPSIQNYEKNHLQQHPFPCKHMSILLVGGGGQPRLQDNGVCTIIGIFVSIAHVLSLHSHRSRTTHMITPPILEINVFDVVQVVCHCTRVNWSMISSRFII